MSVNFRSVALRHELWPSVNVARADDMERVK